MDIPFDKSHVLRITSMHVKRSIDMSIEKSFNRLKDKPEKSQEILETIDVLYKMKQMMLDFESNNEHLYQVNK